MADDPTPTGDPATGKPANPPAPADLGDGGKKALEDERRARRDAERQLKDLQTKVQELEDKDKSETDKLRDQVAQLTKERDEHAAKVLRHEVAMAKGLTAAQAKRLAGSTKEELEADADEILETFGGKKPDDETGGATPPSRRPVATLNGGSDPTPPEPDETDPTKLAASVPRGF